MENKFLGYENEEELTELAVTDVNESGAGTPSIVTSITQLVTKVVCPSGACTSHC